MKKQIKKTKMKREAKKKDVEAISMKKTEKQAMWVFIALFIFLLAFLASLWIAKELKTFDFQGFPFEEKKQGDIVYYTSEMKVEREYGYPLYYSILVRNDPRKLNISGLTVTFLKNFTYISISPNLSACEDSFLALVNLGRFLETLSVPVKSAFNEKKYAKENNASYVVCNSTNQNTVILITTGDSNQMVKRKNCYTIEVADCNILKGTESFMIDTYISSVKRYLM